MTRWMKTSAPRATLIIRLLLGWVFVTEGVQKFLFPAALGVGRFTKLGIPSPHFFAPFVGVVEIVFGLALVAGLLTRLACLPLLISMCVAITTTKGPVLVKDGFWAAAHEGRTDLSMIFCLVFLLIVGAGPWSADARLSGGGKRSV